MQRSNAHKTNFSSTHPNRGQAACALVVATLEAELARAVALRDQYGSGELEAGSVHPLRYFCAGLVETAVELARGVAELTATESPVSAEFTNRDTASGR